MSGRVTITGGLGFLGRLVGRRLVQEGYDVTLFDREGPAIEPGMRTVRGELSNPAALAAAITEGTSLVVHLASMVSAECETDLDGAFATNLQGLLSVLDRTRALSSPPRFLFASSVAVFGGIASADTVSDRTKQTPVTTYGVTKAVGELLVNEYTRKGFIDGRTARLPTVIIRPGKPNAAASSFASGMFREPLAGIDAVVPVPLDTALAVIGHRAAVAGLAKLANLDSQLLHADRAVGLPALEVTAADMHRAITSRPAVTARVEVSPDDAITAVVGSWPGRWDATRGLQLGLPTDHSLDSIIDDYLADFG